MIARDHKPKLIALLTQLCQLHNKPEKVAAMIAPEPLVTKSDRVRFEGPWHSIVTLDCDRLSSTTQYVPRLSSQ
ncbi:MAG: hypothetical protein KDA51_02770 [Planctomycetales bacterium]|nr:hypothetical protein [Planctomycetales bacterium]